MRTNVTTVFICILAAVLLVGCGDTQPPPQSYPSSISADDVVGFRVALAGQADTRTPGPLPAGDVLAELVDAYTRSPIDEFVPTSPGDLVAVALHMRSGEVIEILAGPGYPGDHTLVDTIDLSRDSSFRNPVSSARLLEVVKGLARERLSAAEKRQLDPEGTWLGG